MLWTDGNLDIHVGYSQQKNNNNNNNFIEVYNSCNNIHEKFIRL